MTRLTCTFSTLVCVFCFTLVQNEIIPGYEPRIGNDVPIALLPPYVVEDGSLCSVENQCLVAQDSSSLNGTDEIGAFIEVLNVFTTSSGKTIELSSREYIEEEIVIYQQYFPDGLNGTSSGDKNSVSTAWPVFQIPDSTQSPGLRYVTPGGYMTGWTLYAHGSIDKELHRFRDGESGGIVILALQEGDFVSNVIMTAIEEPMSVNVKLDQELKTLAWGIQGLVENIPAGYSVQIITRSDPQSINKNVMAWGSAMQRFHTSAKLEDLSVDYLGYWTDNGAAHYYNERPFDNFEELLIHTQNYSVQNDIPLRYMQLDSWWYYKGIEDGVKNWTAMPDVFPNGIAYVHEATGWSIVAHNRYFSSDTDYAIQNGGDYPFFIDEETDRSLPLTKDFWDDLLDEGLQWGLYLYEQDWLDRQYEFTSLLHTSATQASTWLNQMGESALERNIPIQYCMAFPRHFLHSVSLPAVTQIRVSDDYMLTPDQWRIGASSLFAHALGLKPFKDNFWSSKYNEKSVFVDCEAVYPIISFPRPEIAHQYGGRKRTTETNQTCLRWTDFGYDVKYPHSGMRENCCRNPEDTEEGSFCFTTASVDVPEQDWVWEYCRPPTCEFECYLLNGEQYFGSYNQTYSGLECADWNGEYGLEGSMCRNPNNDIGLWCYTNINHTVWDYCDNKCPLGAEPNSYLQSAVSTLSTGPVGLGDDSINLNRDIIMKSCRSDGLILKPSKPLTVIDKYFMQSDYVEIWTSESYISNFGFGIILMAEVADGYTLTAFDLNLETSLSSDVVSWVNYPVPLSGLQEIPQGSSIDLPSIYGEKHEFCVLYTAPIIDILTERVAFLGELDKWATVSPQRTKAIEILDNMLVTVEGVIDEIVEFSFWNSGTIVTIECAFLADTSMTIDFNAKTCF